MAIEAEAWEWANAALRSAGLSLSSEWEIVKERPWANVHRAETAAGRVYFKHNAPGGGHEPALLEALSEIFSDRVPKPLAFDSEQRFLLTLDHGPMLRDVLPSGDPLSIWERILPRYAEIQIASARAPERWLALGVPDRRLQRLPELAETLIVGCEDLDADERSKLLELMPELGLSCEALGATAGCDALEHGDLHANNVLLRDGVFWIFDWADASVTHPFSTMLVTCNMASEDLASAQGRRTSARLRDAYLEAWSGVEAPSALREWFSLAIWVGYLGRALDWQHMLAGADGPEVEHWRPHVAKWLRRFGERRAWARPGGWP